jgi:osmotically-inducible protein OsmY
MAGHGVMDSPANSKITGWPSAAVGSERRSPLTEGVRQMGTTKDVRAAVEAELGFDPLVDSADIKVMNVGGDVTLAGTVPSYPQYLEAAAAARRVAGVSGVHNNLMVRLPDSDYRDDVQLITAADNALTANVTVPDGVEAIAFDGDITLTGTVSYISQRAAAEAAVAGLIGVRNVRNDIEISYAIDPVDVDVNVHQALERSALVPDGSDVTSDTKDGVITLTGHVRTWAEHDAVVGAAWMALGVIDVRDELQVTG